MIEKVKKCKIFGSLKTLNTPFIHSIIKTSSNEDSYVLDCFAGSGTTLKAAQQLGRKWIGIDQSEEAIKVIQKRMTNIKADLFTQEIDFKFLKQTEVSLPSCAI